MSRLSPYCQGSGDVLLVRLHTSTSMCCLVSKCAFTQVLSLRWFVSGNPMNSVELKSTFRSESRALFSGHSSSEFSSVP